MSRVVPVVFILGALVVATAVALGTGAVNLPGSPAAKASTQQAAVTGQMAANQQWASATCSTVLGWKDRIQRDVNGLTLSLSAIPRVQDAIGATSRMVDSIKKLGLPPAAKSTDARGHVDQLRSDIESHMHAIESAASGAAAGNLGSIATLLSSLRNIPSMEGQIVGHLRDLTSEFGVSLASSPSCRQLVGLKF